MASTDSWPEFVGAEVEYVTDMLMEEDPNLVVLPVLEGTEVPEDYDPNRVWLWHNEEMIVVEIPKRG